jgi:hypothetical protein
MFQMDIQTIFLFATVGILLLLAIATLFIRRTIMVTVERFSWERRVVLEAYVWMEESSHIGYPDGSRNHQKTTEHYQSYEVVRHETRSTTMNGNTTTTTQPVYGFVPRTRTKYSYELQRWVKSRELQAAGEERSTLHWPAYIPDNSQLEQEKSRQEKYLVFFRTPKGKTYKYKLSEAAWAALDDTAIHILKVTIFGQIMEIIPAEKQVAEMPEQTS